MTSPLLETTLSYLDPMTTTEQQCECGGGGSFLVLLLVVPEDREEYIQIQIILELVTTMLVKMIRCRCCDDGLH